MAGRGVLGGRALRREEISTESEARFWAKIDKGAPGDHWMWTACAVKGIPMFALERSNWTARRVVWALTFGEVPAGVPIGACAEPLCLNPEHLTVTTGEELARRRVEAGQDGGRYLFSRASVADMRRRYQAGERAALLFRDVPHATRPDLSRMLRNDTYFDASYVPPPARRGSPGEDNHWAKMTMDDVRQIRQLFADGVTVSALARQYGLAQSTMWEAVHGTTWIDPGYVPPPVGAVRLHDPTLFSPGSAGAGGFCGMTRRHRKDGGRSGAVVDVHQDVDGRPGGRWMALCASCAARSGVDVAGSAP